MNTPNNRRRRDSQRRIEAAFVRLLEEREIEQITVTDLCRAAQVNRSTFYSNYEDIYDLADRLQQQLAEEVLASCLPTEEAYYVDRGLLALFTMVRDNRLLFRACFKLGIDQFTPAWELDPWMSQTRYGNRNLDYHVAFFRAGLNAILRHWLERDCAEPPEELLHILRQEYGVNELILAP